MAEVIDTQPDQNETQIREKNGDKRNNSTLKPGTGVLEIQINLVENGSSADAIKKPEKVLKTEGSAVLKKEKNQKSSRKKLKMRNADRVNPHDVLNNLRCFAVFGLRNYWYTFLNIVSCSFPFVTFILFSSSPANLFHKAGRPGVWVFAVLSCGFVFLCIFFLISWKNQLLDISKSIMVPQALGAQKTTKQFFQCIQYYVV